jgi:general secretion pathway protein D
MCLLRKLLLMTVFLPLIAGCSGGFTAFHKAETLVKQGRLDEAVMMYAQAMAADPGKGEYKVGFLKASEKAARIHFDRGQDYMSVGKYEDAIREFQTAFTLDSSLDRAYQMSDQAVKLRDSRLFYADGVEFENHHKMREALASYKKAVQFDPSYKEASDAVDRLMKSRKSKLDGFELNLKSTKPITLKFRDAKIKEVFNILSQLSGINFIFDEGVKDQNVTIFLENATFYQALEILTGMHKLGRKVLNESTIIVYAKTPEKEKQYEDLMVETFQLNKLDAKKAVNLIRTMLPAKKIYVNEDINALVMRDTPESLEVARKILEANDIQDAEVVLEVEIIEVDKTYEDNFGLALSKYSVSAQLYTYPGNNPISDTLAASSNSNTTNPNLAKLFTWGNYAGFMTVPSATFNFAKTLANGQTLSNPKIRVKNREKAKFNVGQRIPITTTSSTTVGTQTTVNVQYVDVGVKMNAEPVIQLDNNITIKVSLEVSSAGPPRDVGAGNQVVDINTRNLDTVLSLKDGETSVIGGLIQRIDSDSRNKISVLGDIPIIGPLLSNKVISNKKGELILAITPHIVRSIYVSDADVASFWTGKEDDPSVMNPYGSFVQEPEIPVPAMPPKPIPTAPARPAPITAPGTPPQPPQPISPAGGEPATAPQKAVAAAGVPAVPPLPGPPAAPPGSQQAVPQGGSALQSAAGAAGGNEVTPPRMKVSLNIGAPSSVNLNDRFNVNVVASNTTDIYSAPFVISYDPALLDYEGAREGNFFNRDSKQTVFQATGVKNSGQVSISLARSGGGPGVTGTGTLAVLTFRAKGPGKTVFGIVKSELADSTGKLLESQDFNAVTTVKPQDSPPATK